MPAPASSEVAIDPPTQTNKRKRSGLVDNQDINGGVNDGRISPIQNSLGKDSLTQQRLRDISQVLSRYDTTPSILQYALLDPSTSETGEEPGTKRAKLADDANHDTIAKKIQRQRYKTFEEFLADVDQATNGVLSSAKPEDSHEDPGSQWRYSPRTLGYPRLVAHAQAFRKNLDNLVRSEWEGSAPSLTNGVHYSPHQKQPPVGIKDERAKSFLAPGRRAVLTLFGNAQGHKQLFSSAQKPLPRHLWTNPPKSEAGCQSHEAAIMPLRESGLPNQIFSTETMPVDGSTNHNRPTIFIDAYGPPPSLRPMSPPKMPKYPTTRESSITWTHDTPAQDPSRKLEYTEQKLPAGQWLGYNGMAPSQEPSSPEEKRKRRDRALSTGEASFTPSEGAKVAQLRAKEEALFRSAYSSFAPSKDNSSALVPEEVRSRIWWDKAGQFAFNQTFPLDAEFEGDESIIEGVPGDGSDEERILREAVEQFDPSPAEPADALFDAKHSPESTTDALREVGELLETLHSYQRIRNSSIGGKGRSSTSASTSSQEMNGLSVPTKNEQETYKNIRSRLVTLIGALPPYALAKLKGQFSDLIVSQRLIVEGEIYRGTMEEDQLSRMARNAALNAALGATSGARPMATPGTRNSQNVQPSRPTPLQQYTNASQGGGRAGSSFQRQSLSSWQNTPQAYTSSTQRPPYSQPPNYSRQQTTSQLGPRQSGSGVPIGYSQTSNQQTYQQRAQGWNNPSQPKNASPPQAYQQFTQPNNRPGSGYQGSNGPMPLQASTVAQARPNYTALAAQQMRSQIAPASPIQPPTANMKSFQGSPSGPRPHTPLTPAQATVQRQPSQTATANATAAQKVGTQSGATNHVGGA